MDFYSAELTCYKLIFLTQVPANQGSGYFPRNTPYVHSKLDLILELCRAFPIEFRPSALLDASAWVFIMEI